nr:radical SAM protein [Lachnospiraceae bacterium]
MRELSLYLHIPFCVRKCAYCDFPSSPENEETRERYVNCLIREIRSYQGRELARRPIATIFIGGGTPSVLSTSQLVRIMDCVRDTFMIGSASLHNYETTGDESGGGLSDELCDGLHGVMRDGLHEHGLHNGATSRNRLKGDDFGRFDLHNVKYGGGVEISMEVNPGSVTPEKCKELCKHIANRFSIGLQSANDEELQRIGRIHNYRQFLETYDS